MVPQLFVLQAALVGLGIFAAMVLCQYLGRRLGQRDRRLDPEHEKGIGAAEGAVYGILGLFLAFAFSGATDRFDERRHMIVDESNAIGTAWLRLDLLPEADRPELRALFRAYLDARIETYRKVPDMPAVYAAHARALGLQEKIWSSAVASCGRSPNLAGYNLLLPALNEMFDLASTRVASTKIHPPGVVYGILGILAIVASLFAGYGFAGRRSWSWFHAVGFAAVTAGAIFLSLNLEYPRLGFIRVDAMDQVMIDLRASMK